MTIPSFYVEPAHYSVDLDDLRQIREAVFVLEQHISPDVEFDAQDQHCYHFIARDPARRAIGTGRLSPEGKLGRMAVLAPWRNQGVGASLLQALLEKSRQLGLTHVTAHAQHKALGFYQKFGFMVEGATFIEAGIPHQKIFINVAPLEPSRKFAAMPREAVVEAARLETLESAIEATLHLICDARRQLCLYTRDLEYGLYGRNDIVRALKQFALAQRNASVQIIVQEPANLRGQTHPVLELAQRLPSRFLLSTPVEADDLQYQSAYLINDSDGYLFRLQGNRFEGHWSSNLPARNRRISEEFERVWNRSRPCAEFRALGL